MLEAWSEKAKAMKCPICDEWILVGVTQSGRTEAATIAVVTPENVASYLGVSRKMYAVIGDGYLLALSSRERVPMALWRPAHPCGIPEAPQRAARASQPVVCPWPGAIGCAGDKRSITGCPACPVTDPEPPPFDDAPSVGSHTASPFDAVEHLLIQELKAVLVERTMKSSGRVVFRSNDYSDYI